MFGVKLLACAALLLGVSGRTLMEDHPHYYFLEDVVHDEPAPISEEAVVPIQAGRQRRQVHGSFVANPDGTSNLNMKLPLAGNDKNMLSAIGGLGLTRNQNVASGTAGLALDNVNGHGMTLTKTFIPGVGDRLAAAGQVNLFHNDNHNLAANAFAARTTLNNPAVPSFNTVGGGLDYMFKNKVGAGLSVARTPLFDKTDYSATGNLNLFRNRDSSLDFRAGFSKSISPFIPSRSWEPSAGLSFTKYF